MEKEEKILKLMKSIEDFAEKCEIKIDNSFKEALLNYSRIEGVYHRPENEKIIILGIVAFHSILSATPEGRVLKAKDVYDSLMAYCCPKDPTDTCKKTAESIIKKKEILSEYLLPDKVKTLLTLEILF